MKTILLLPLLILCANFKNIPHSPRVKDVQKEEIKFVHENNSSLSNVNYFDPISAVTTAYTVISKGFDLYKQYRGLKEMSRIPLESAEFQSTLKKYFNDVNNKLDQLVNDNKEIIDLINANTKLLEDISNRVDQVIKLQLDQHYATLKATSQLILNETTTRGRLNRFNQNQAAYLISLSYLIENEYRLEKIIEIPKYCNFYLFNINPLNLDQDYISTEKTQMLDKLDNLINRLNKGLDKLNVSLFYDTKQFYYLLGFARAIDLIRSPQMHGLINNVVNLSSYETIPYIGEHFADSRADAIDKQIIPYTSSIPKSAKICESYSLLVASLLIYRDSLGRDR